MSATETPTASTCTAYPDGIPEEIGAFGKDHRVAHGGERHGYLFKRAEGIEADDAWTWWSLFDEAKRAKAEKGKR
jgi:hypothetical protein